MTRAPASAPHVITLTGTDDGGEAQTVFFARMDTRRSIPVFEDDARKAVSFGSKREAEHVIVRLRDFWKREMAGPVPPFKARAIAGRKSSPVLSETPRGKNPSDSAPMIAGKIAATLNKRVKFDGEEMTRREMIARLVARGDGVFTYEENKIKPMSRAAYFRADGRQQDEHERKIREGGKVTRYAIGTRESWFDIGRIEYDFALSLGARSLNPVPASRHAGNARPSRSRIGKAADLYRRFTGNEPHKAARLVDESARGDAFLRVGAVDGILYTTNREGKAEKYIHHFRPESRPELLVTHDGKVARTLGGRFTFTERGFVDEDAAGNAVE